MYKPVYALLFLSSIIVVLSNDEQHYKNKCSFTDGVIKGSIYFTMRPNFYKLDGTLLGLDKDSPYTVVWQQNSIIIDQVEITTDNTGLAEIHISKSFTLKFDKFSSREYSITLKREKDGSFYSISTCKSSTAADKLLADEPVASANCIFKGTKNNEKIKGEVSFIQYEDSLTIAGKIYGLTPKSTHGFHIHELGDISGVDGMKTRNHYNPLGNTHQCPPNKRHEGDFGNIDADSTGVATPTFTDLEAQLYEENSIIGRALIIHEKPDDCESQPTGNAGARIAQCVIGIIDEANNMAKAGLLQAENGLCLLSDIETNKRIGSIHFQQQRSVVRVYGELSQLDTEAFYSIKIKLANNIVELLSSQDRLIVDTKGLHTINKRLNEQNTAYLGRKVILSKKLADQDVIVADCIVGKSEAIELPSETSYFGYYVILILVAVAVLYIWYRRQMSTPKRRYTNVNS